jgi:hypothetical protein
LVALTEADQAPRMQADDDWMPVRTHEPGPRHAARPPEPGSRETDLELVSAEPGWRGRSARTCVSERMHEAVEKQPTNQMKLHADVFMQDKPIK